MTEQTDDIVKKLKDMTCDLSYPSESTYPFIVYRMRGTEILLECLLRISNRDCSHKTEEVALPFLFNHYHNFREWMILQDNRKIRKYQDMISYLYQSLSQIKAYRIGELLVDIFITGRTADGDYIILATKAIERSDSGHLEMILLK